MQNCLLLEAVFPAFATVMGQSETTTSSRAHRKGDWSSRTRAGFQMHHRRTTVTSTDFSGQNILASHPIEQALCPRSHQCCRLTEPIASPCPGHSLRAVHAFSHSDHTNKSGQKPGRRNKQDGGHRIYPTSPIQCQKPIHYFRY